MPTKVGSALVTLQSPAGTEIDERAAGQTAIAAFHAAVIAIVSSVVPSQRAPNPDRGNPTWPVEIAMPDHVNAERQGSCPAPPQPVVIPVPENVISYVPLSTKKVKDASVEAVKGFALEVPAESE